MVEFLGIHGDLDGRFLVPVDDAGNEARLAELLGSAAAGFGTRGDLQRNDIGHGWHLRFPAALAQPSAALPSQETPA
jgi:hypothetical protein